jgi:putative phosphoribosyl transferase
MIFANRTQAGKAIAATLSNLKGQDAIVFGLPRGGVVVAAEIAKALQIPIQTISVKKIGHPMQRELAIGAVGERGPAVLDNIDYAEDAQWLRRAISVARHEAKRRHERYQSIHAPVSASHKIAIIADDGIATGFTMRAAIHAVQDQSPDAIIVVAPVGAAPAVKSLRRHVEARVLYVPGEPFGAVGQYYDDFEEVSDADVVSLIDDAKHPPEEKLIDLTALDRVLATVKQYPVTNQQLAERARDVGAPSNVAAFFESIPGEVQFSDRSDVRRRSEEADVIMEEEAIAPKERLRSYD